MTPARVSIRRGLPRVAGGEPWPTFGNVAPVSQVDTPTDLHITSEVAMADLGPVRRGLPRVPGGEPWPPWGPVGVVSVHQTPGSRLSKSQTFGPQSSEEQSLPIQALRSSDSSRETTSTAKMSSTSGQDCLEVAQPATILEKPAEDEVNEVLATPRPRAEDKKADNVQRLIAGKSLQEWAKLLGLGALVVVGAAGAVVLMARGVTTLPGVDEFLVKYPGHYALPSFVEPGVPAWARWTHYLNFFFMVLIVRSGLAVRLQKKPPAFFTGKRSGTKVSIYVWMHTSLDILWAVNGIAFVVLLFVSGHWARIVPTSWEVFPQALSSLLQYLTLEWPLEDGWVNYNSLQQIMYFLVVFVAAPLAAITGLRMSDWWPENAKRLNRVYPAALARAIHFPVMLFFVLFVVVHVFLVFTTGMLRNLGHMFAGTSEIGWTGFLMFALGLAVAVLAAVAARPMILAQLARPFGRTSSR